MADNERDVLAVEVCHADHDKDDACGFGIFIADVVLDSDWLRDHDAAVAEAARATERERIARAIEAHRNEHWQQHLAHHPFANAGSCPADYGKHDAYYDAACIARALSSMCEEER